MNYVCAPVMEVKLQLLIVPIYSKLFTTEYVDTCISSAKN
jgi:hypothetical protein